MGSGAPPTQGPGAGVRLSARPSLPTAGAGRLLGPLGLGGDDAYSAALASRPARNVGTVSYGLFLWHLPVFAGLFALTGAQVFAGGIVPLLAVVPFLALLVWERAARGGSEAALRILPFVGLAWAAAIVGYATARTLKKEGRL